MLPRILKVFADWEAELTNGFTEEEREDALSLLIRMYENAERVTDSLRGQEDTGKGGSGRCVNLLRWRYETECALDR